MLGAIKKRRLMGTEFSLERQKSFGDIDGESTAM
jgi:hypothetical protein